MDRGVSLRNPECQVHFVLGNHDAHQGVVDKLCGYAGRNPRFQWHPYFLRLSSYLFLHGDIVDGEYDHDRLDARRRVSRHFLARSRLKHVLYQAVAHLRALRVLTIALSERRILARINAYVEKIGHDASNGGQMSISDTPTSK